MGDQHGVGFGDRQLLRLGLLAEHLAHHVVQIDHADLGAGHAGHVEGRHAAGRFGNLDFDFLVRQLALAQHLAELFAGFAAGVVADQHVQHAFLGVQFGLGGHVLAHALARHVNRGFQQVADDLLDVAADVADLGELGRFHLDERRLCQFGQPTGDLGLADAGRADHQDVLRQHLVLDRALQLLAAPAVAQRNGDRALGVVLADDVAVQFGNDLAGGEAGHRLSMVTLEFV